MPKPRPTTVLPPDAHPALSPQTYYVRLSKGWDLDRAKSTPPYKAPPSPWADLEKGKSRAFRLPKAWESDFEGAIQESGLSASDWVAQAIAEKLGIKQ